MLTVLTPPVGDVITLAQAKAHLRVIFDDDDATIGDYIATAVELCADAIARAFLPTQFRLALAGFPGQGQHLDPRVYDLDRRYLERPLPYGLQPIYLPRAPVLTVDSITYLDASGIRQTLAPSAYHVEPGDGARVLPAYGQTWPSARVIDGSIRVDFTAGYVDSDAIPAKIKHAVRVTLAYLYDNRGAEVDIPQAALDLLRACDWGYQP